jgi:hypothetical protein
LCAGKPYFGGNLYCRFRTPALSGGTDGTRADSFSKRKLRPVWLPERPAVRSGGACQAPPGLQDYTDGTRADSSASTQHATTTSSPNSPLTSQRQASHYSPTNRGDSITPRSAPVECTMVGNICWGYHPANYQRLTSAEQPSRLPPAEF